MLFFKIERTIRKKQARSDDRDDTKRPIISFISIALYTKIIPLLDTNCFIKSFHCFIH